MGTLNDLAVVDGGVDGWAMDACVVCVWLGQTCDAVHIHSQPNHTLVLCTGRQDELYVTHYRPFPDSIDGRYVASPRLIDRLPGQIVKSILRFKYAIAHIYIYTHAGSPRVTCWPRPTTD